MLHNMISVLKAPENILHYLQSWYEPKNLGQKIAGFSIYKIYENSHLVIHMLRMKGF